MKTVLLSAAVSLFIALFGTPFAIKAFTRRGLGQEIRSDGPAHMSKRGTPTMGGTVIITLSVLIQVGSFKLTGKRVFRMAPLQHHFELVGWAETTIVVRFWIIAGICVALGLGIFYVG